MKQTDKIEDDFLVSIAPVFTVKPFTKFTTTASAVNIARIAKAALRKSHRLSRCQVVFTKRCHYNYYCHYRHYHYHHNLSYFFSFVTIWFLSFVTIGVFWVQHTMSTNIPLMYSMFGLAGTGGQGGSLCLSHAFWITSIFYRVLGRCPGWQARSISWSRTSWRAFSRLLAIKDTKTKMDDTSYVNQF